MNKDDIFTFTIIQNDTSDYTVKCALAWDLTTVLRVSCTDERQISYVKKEAMGWMWDIYADKIIAHIQSEKRED